MQFTATAPVDGNDYRFIGFSRQDTQNYYGLIEFAVMLRPDGYAYPVESGNYAGGGLSFVSYAAGDIFQVAVAGGVVKYKKNGTVFYTSTVTPSYPLRVGTSLWETGGTLTNVIIAVSSSSSSSVNIQWLVADQLGTPRMIIDKTGLLANVSRHDYLPFGEELGAGTGGRTTAQGYSANDGVRQHFTQKERDNETGLDYFGARYYTSTQGRFSGADPIPVTRRISSTLNVGISTLM
jgi:RHS repeat-associated protein